MDEGAEVRIPIKGEFKIENHEFVFRQVHEQDLTGEEPRFPKESHFKPDPDGLSVYLERLIVEKNIFITIALTHKKIKPGKAAEFKDHRKFRVFKFNVAFLRGIEGIDDVIYDPMIHGNPSPVGNPNIQSHSSVLYSLDDEEIRLKLSGHSQNPDCHCNIDSTTLDAEIEELRARLNETPFHRLTA